jgi:flagellar biosynthetic protein FlhB
MATDDKTEAPTAKRKHEARKKGQVAKSPDFNGALVLVMGLFTVSMLAPSIVSSMASAMRQIFAMVAHSGQQTSASGLHQLVSLVETTMVSSLAPLGSSSTSGKWAFDPPSASCGRTSSA